MLYSNYYMSIGLMKTRSLDMIAIAILIDCQLCQA